MKDITQFFAKKNILFKDFKEVLPKELNSRKKIQIFVGTTIDLKFYAIFVVDSKSRFIRRNADDLMELCQSLSSFVGHNFKVKELLISSSLCSKAKEYLKEFGWSVRVDFM
ncbi:hypothetical protein [Aliarcobacter vitoriensis]|uniref:Uncharacterized protein n=1 Tax=Aliarcobacter vitoriensis TaxID=2011099 RepID=A0A366MUN9_9BACT|nr:hypothetical protein [Aliarcobacter vitoriensis]RBQ29102.1 hypothetical protein CRU91_05830 [Aliarcobacter vitoriensis]